KVVLVVNTHENLIRKHVEHHSYPVPVRLVRQTVLNGLPGAIAAAIPELEGTVLMHLPDNVFTDKYDYALAQHERVKGTLTTIVEPIAPRFGRPAATVQDGRITRIAPSTGTQGEHSVAGLYIFGRYFAELCRKHCEASTEGEVEIGAVMKDLLSSGKIIGAAVIHGIRHDVSTLQDRDRAANNVEG
ncbi:hypothetical protein HY642_00440, partial [Candidatus Woesearchaeota archaeon]|nr:hypothetical protein [Candidatus Woesearchaeota archaeon]